MKTACFLESSTYTCTVIFAASFFTVSSPTCSHGHQQARSNLLRNSKHSWTQSIRWLVVFLYVLIKSTENILPGLGSHLAIKSVPAGEQGMLAEARGSAWFPSPPSGCVDHLQLCITQSPVDTHTWGLPLLLIVCAAQPCRGQNDFMSGLISSRWLIFFCVHIHLIRVLIKACLRF